MSEVPFELQGFEPLSRIGGGGFGDVWLARQVNIDRKVAIKVGHAPIDDKTVQLRFERECIALGRLSGHPNIIDVFTAGQLDDDRPYLVLEFVNGGTLWQRLQRGPLSEPELCRVGGQLCDALSVAHGAGVLHRDLKPENVLLRQTGDAVLGDFGIARLHDGANTTSHAITASVAYAAPEILSGKSASVASDLYGIGICLLACILRSVPFVHKTDESIHPIINRVLTDKPPDLRHHGVSDGLSTAIRSLLEKDPNKRPSSALEAKAMIERAANPPPPTQVAGPPPGPSPSGPTVPVVTPAPAPNLDIGAAAARSGGHAIPTPTANDTQIAGPTSFPPAGPIARTGAPPQHPSGPNPAVPGQPPSYPPPQDHRPSPLQAQPYSPAGAPPTFTTPAGKNDRIRVFGAAFGATLLIGGLFIFLLTRLTGDDDGVSTSGSTTITTTEDGTANGGSVDDASGTTTSSSTTSTTTTTTTAPPAGPITLPLTIADTQLSEGSEVTPDTEGPDSAQFCDNTPVTAGLADWQGETLADPAGFPIVFQQVARFDTAAQASAYVASYMATVNCTEWVIPGEAGGPDILVTPRVISDPTATYGDDTREIAFEGEADFITIVARAALVRNGADVYLMSVTSVLQTDVNDLDRLLALAVDRLGY